MAAHNHSRVAHYVTALTVVAFSLKSTNHKTSQAQNTIVIILQADWSNLNYLDRRDSGCCQSVLAHFVLGVTVDRHLVSTDNVFEENMTMNGILLQEGESTTNSLQLVVVR